MIKKGDVLTKYMSICPVGNTDEAFKLKLKEEIENSIWYLENIKPNVPYIKLKIKVIEVYCDYPKESWVKKLIRKLFRWL